MKILICNYGRLDKASGSPTRARLIAEGLNHVGMRVAVVAQSVPAEFNSLGIVFYPLEQGISYLETLNHAISVFNPDWVYGITEGNADVITEAAKQAGCKLAFDMHGIGVVEIIELGKGYGPRMPRIKNSISWLKAMAKADIITVVSSTCTRVARIMYPKVKVVPLIGMADVEKFSPEGKTVFFGKDPTKIQVLYIGSLFKWQGVRLLIKAAKLVNNISTKFEFTIVGSIGSEYEKAVFSELQATKNLINYYPFIDYQFVPCYIRAADILVIPRPFMLSTYLGIPHKLGEFMASGRFIIATDIAPHRWALKDPLCGLLCPPNARGIATAILKSQTRKSVIIMVLWHANGLYLSFLIYTRQVFSINYFKPFKFRLLIDVEYNLIVGDYENEIT